MLKIRGFVFALFVLCLTSCTADFDEAVKVNEKELSELFAAEGVVENVMIVKFSREVADELSIVETRTGELSTGSVTLDEICNEYDIVSIERVFPMDRFAERKRAMGLDQWYTVRVSGARKTEDAAVRLHRMEGVLSVTPDIRPKRLDTGKAQYLTRNELAQLTTNDITRGSTLLNDPLLPEQWMLKNIGPDSKVYGGGKWVAGADINVEDAWRKCCGHNSVIVSVVDGGVDYNHPDLRDNMWSGIGYNFVDLNDKVSAEEHGTHVAGTIAAVGNNGIGVSGVAGGRGYGDGVKIMSCQIFSNNDLFYASETDTAKAIVYGADNGAVISQNSWGYDATIAATDSQFASRLGVIKTAIDYFVQNAGLDENGNQVGPMAGGVVFFAAGNDGKDQPEYPGAYSKCLSVAAMSGDFKATWYSTYSTVVDFLAPGGDYSYDIGYDDYSAWNLSTLPTSVKNGDTYKDSNGRTQIVDYVHETTTGYGYMIGTSMACPHASGAAALIVSYCGGEGFTATRLKEIMLNSARDVDSYQANKHKGKVGKLIDVAAAFELGGQGPLYDSKIYPVIKLVEGKQNMHLLNNEKVILKYELAYCDRVEISDPNIEMSRVENSLTVIIDASKYALGSHSVVITVGNIDGESNATFSFTIDEISVMCFPNPFDKELNVRLSEIKGEKCGCLGHIRIINSLGIEVFESDVLFNEKKNLTLNLDTEALNPGRYTVEVDVNYNDVVYSFTRTVIKR